VVRALDPFVKPATKEATPKATPDVRTPAAEGTSDDKKRLLRAPTRAPSPEAARPAVRAREVKPTAAGDVLSAKTTRPVAGKKWLIVPLSAVLLLGVIGVFALRRQSPPADNADPVDVSSRRMNPAPDTVPAIDTSKRRSSLPIEWARYPSSEKWESKLKQLIDYEGIDNPKTTLSEELEKLSKKYDLRFDIDERAFKYENVMEAGMTEIANPNPIPRRRASIAVVIDTILHRSPVPSGACYQIREDHILITTPPFRFVTVDTTMESVPLWEFLDFIEHNFNYGIDRNLSKDKEKELVKIVATKDVLVGVLVKRVLRQVGVADPFLELELSP
jgi:hypothetical protein